MQYIAKTPIKCNGVEYAVGAVMNLSESEAADLLQYDAVTKVDEPFTAIVKVLGEGQ